MTLMFDERVVHNLNTTFKMQTTRFAFSSATNMKTWEVLFQRRADKNK